MKRISTVILTGLLLFSINAFAQKQYTGDGAANWVQQQRKIADSLFDIKNATPKQLTRGVRLLQHALTFLDSLPIKEMARTNAYLWYRRSDANRDLASGYALLHQKDSAIVALNRMYTNGSSSGVAGFMQQDSSLNWLRNEPEYLAIIHKLEQQRALWNNTAFRTPYQVDLPLAEKVAGLSLLWSQAKYNFVYFDHANIDWNQAYLNYLPLVEHTTSTADYYKVLIRFYAQLKDGHTNVYVPDALTSTFYSRPPFRTELIEGRIFVNQVFSDSLYRTGIIPGLEIIKIDGQPAISYAEKNVRPYQSSSTPQDMEIREFSYALLAGPKDKPVMLELKDPKGKVFNRTLSRAGSRDSKGLKTMEYQVIGNIGYLTINNFEDERIIKQFDSLYTTSIAKTKGLIIDIRYNGGGSGDIGYSILKRLTNKPFLGSDSRVLRIYSTPYGEPQWQINGTSNWNPNGKLYYDKPVVLLIGPRTFSAAEDFTVAFDAMKRGKLIGLPTGGSTGQPVPFSLPGGGSARICGKQDTYPDGKVFVGLGIQPNVLVKRTIKDLLNGTDAAKQQALNLLNKQ